MKAESWLVLFNSLKVAGTGSLLVIGSLKATSLFSVTGSNVVPILYDPTIGCLVDHVVTSHFKSIIGSSLPVPSYSIAPMLTAIKITSHGADTVV